MTQSSRLQIIPGPDALQIQILEQEEHREINISWARFRLAPDPTPV
jgi:hypothetical protein